MPAPGVGEGEAEPQPVASRRQPSTAAMKTHLVAIYTGRGKPAPQEWVANSTPSTSRPCEMCVVCGTVSERRGELLLRGAAFSDSCEEFPNDDTRRLVTEKYFSGFHLSRINLAVGQKSTSR